MDAFPDTSVLMTVITFSSLPLYEGAFTTNVAPAMAGTGAVIAALISAPVIVVENCTAPIATLYALRSNCSFCAVLNSGRFVAPTILAFVKLVPETAVLAKFTPDSVAPVKLAPVSVDPASDTPDWIVAPANDVPVKSFPARFPVSVCPARDDTIDTVSVLLSTVALAYVDVAAWVAVKYIGPPAATMVIWPVLTLMVATAVLLLAYVIAPSLALLGAVVIDNVPAPYVPEEGTVKVAEENADVTSATVSVLLSTVPLA